MTDEAYAEWLANPSSIKLILVEVVASVSGVETTRYLSTGGYVTSATDTPANTVYLPVVTQGIQISERISLSGNPSLNVGDLEVYNTNGERDSWLSDVWVNRPIQVFIGDPRWVRSDFRIIFNGLVSDIGSKSRDKLNIILRDKLQQLNTPLSDVVLGGATSNKDRIIPSLFGECHNITPLLTNPVTLEYQIHGSAIESLIEVRDNGVPITVTPDLANGKFTLSAPLAGAITVSAQGDKPSTYSNTISALIQRIVTGYGKTSTQFVTGDLDTDNLDAFEAANTQPVGIYSTSRENVLSVCQKLASSIGASIIMSREGKLRIIQVTLPAVGTPREITSSQMLFHSLQVVSRTDVTAASKIGFCKNWTVQSSLLTGIPTEHKDLYALEWLTATATDPTTQTTYKLDEEPVQQDTMLLVESDAQAEADRLLAIYKVPRTVYKFEGTPDLLTLELGDAVTITHARFGMENGKTGMIVGLTPNWLNGRIMVEVLI